MKDYFHRSVPAAPLSVFRIAIGLMLFLSIARFWLKGWIDVLYVKPAYYFSFYGFEFVKPLGEYTYILFFICALSALLVAIGFLYRFTIITLFLSFTYIELMDKSAYLNHYYFISLVLFLMMFLPANRYFSVDAYKNRKILSGYIPQWCIDSIKFMVVIVYFYSGLAKLNSDWILHALPLKIWLPARNDMPVIGFLFNYTWVYYAFSWVGCLYDLTIGFLLWNKKTRMLAYITVVIFHGLTALLFPIGMFPYIMIVTALIFFSPGSYTRIIKKLNRFIRLPSGFIHAKERFRYKDAAHYTLVAGFSLFFIIQLLLPFRYMLYKDELFWTEQGYRFSWRVMLMEKAGYAQFTVKDANGKYVIVNNNNFLTALQEKMVSTQPDMILQYAHILRDYYSTKGYNSPQVYVDSYVALNGRMGKVLVNPKADLAKEEESFKQKTWLMPFNDEIKGF
jgi:hypothetical protein